MYKALQPPIVSSPRTPCDRSDSNPAIRDEAIQRRTEELLNTEICFIASPEFCPVQKEHSFASAVDSLPQNISETPADLPAHLRRMCDTALLSQEQERDLFREMNYLKFRANALRSRLDPELYDPETVITIDELLASVQVVREHLIKANMRLVISIVKKYVSRQFSFDELLSEGTFTLIQAVEKFDYSRGFRFSTYAYRSIVRRIYRLLADTRRDQDRVTLVADDWPFANQENHRGSVLSDQIWGHLREQTKEMLEQLDRRERLIIRSRYALGSHHKVTTFQALADKLGVSKERVRQLEQRAVKKLHAMAATMEVDELFSAAMV